LARQAAGNTEDFVSLRRLHRTESEVFEAAGRFEDALDAFRSFKAADDSLQNVANRDRLADLQTRYRTREQEQEIVLLQREREIATLYRRLLIGGLFGLALFVFLLYSRFRMKARSHSELEEAHDALSDSLQRLTETQDRLIHAEKMASLGQLTAGIAHEIKNPLNFINNFADLNSELVDELTHQLAADPDVRLSDVQEDLDDLRANALQISKHGTRADGIVRSMLEHSRVAPGERRPVDINVLVEEYANLAYHGARATSPTFQASFECDFDPEAGIVVCQPQEIGRVLINLLDNAFYAVRRTSEERTEDVQPAVTVVTRGRSDEVVIEITDNGTGIPEEVLGNIFEPFFTTKPTGTGTGLGLSLSFDIITRGNGGSMQAENLPEGGARFTIRLPRVQE
jgi:signal transduction histidine kinase